MKKQILTVLFLMCSVALLPSQEVKNVILCIGDGMGVGPITITRVVKLGVGGKLNMEKLPVVGLVRTHSDDNAVTDSAAAGTAIATGFKTYNRMIGVTSDGTSPETLVEFFKKKKMATGIITTNDVYDATPAAFYAHVAARSSRDIIVTQLADKDIDVVLGGGRTWFLPDGVEKGRRKDNRNIIDEMKSKGYTYVSNKTELLNARNAKKLVGIFYDYAMNYVIDKEELNIVDVEPTISEMTSVALDVLAKNKHGFFLMVEGAKIDYAAHAADIAGVVAETFAFDEAVGVCYEFAKNRDDTLLIITADHDTMGISLSEPFDYESLKMITASPEYMVTQFKKDESGVYTSDSIKEAVQQYTTVVDNLTDSEIKSIQDTSREYPYKTGWIVGSIIAERLNVAIMSDSVRQKSQTGGHTGNIVPLFAYGPQSGLFDGYIDNTEISTIITTRILK